MYNSKLYSILEHFNKYEQNRCRKYITSPYFNKNQSLIYLFEVLIEAINSARKKSLEKEDIWAEIAPDQAYDDVRFRKYCSDLLKLVEGFLAQQIYEENPLHQATYLIDAVGNRKLEKLYNSTMKSARRLSKQQRHKPASYYFYQYEIEKNYYNLTNYEKNRAARTNIEDIANNLDAFYLAEKLRIYCSVLTQQYFVSQEYQLLFIEEIIEHLERYKQKYEDYPPISIYYQVFLTSTDNENVEHYYKLKDLLNKHALEFPKEEALTIYYSAINYCIRKLNTGNQQFSEELFELYNSLLEKEIIFVNDELSPWTFKNICVLGLRLGKYDWTENFIQSYYHKLPEESRENAVSYNMAQLYFYQQQYDNVIKLLHTVEYEDPSYNLNSKTMLLATYYETDEIEPLYSLLESFRTYLNRHKSDIPDYRRIHYSNLIKFTKKLLKIMPGDQPAVKRLKEEITNTKHIASIQWLNEKVAELE